MLLADLPISPSPTIGSETRTRLCFLARMMATFGTRTWGWPLCTTILDPTATKECQGKGPWASYIHILIEIAGYLYFQLLYLLILAKCVGNISVGHFHLRILNREWVLYYLLLHACRIRYGYAHVVNNLYREWSQYAIGGSMNPSVKSEANLFIAPKSGNKKEVIINSNVYIFKFKCNALN